MAPNCYYPDHIKPLRWRNKLGGDIEAVCLYCEAATRQPGDVFAKDKKKSPVVINNFQIALIPVYLKPAPVPGLTINVLLLWLHMQKQTQKGNRVAVVVYLCI